VNRYARIGVVGAAVVASLSSAPRRPYSRQQKAFYADTSVVEFVRPGLTITVNSAGIVSNGTISVIYSLSDPNGLPLDSTGTTTPGTIVLSFAAAVLPNGASDYAAYTTAPASGTVLTATQQPAADSGGTITSLGSGQYQYVFHTKAPTGFDATATHTIGVYGSRNLTVYSLGTDYASTTYSFVPNGSPVTHIHDQIETASCNNCHDQLSAHGGLRRGMDLCVICHTPQNFDPNTGNSMDSKVLFHKIHMGASLPSVIAGTPYKVVTSFGTSDYSHIVYEADPGDPRRCNTCHSQTTGATQANAYLANPTRAACGACHDNVNFATGANHAGLAEADDSQCATCHIPQGTTDFDVSILGAHVVPTSSSLLSGLALNITKVQNGTAGAAPVVSFTVLNSSGQGIPLSQLAVIQLTMAGPTTDYGSGTLGTSYTPGYITESAAGATCDAGGNCVYTFTHPLPPQATGTYAIGIEAQRTETVLAGTASQQSITYGAPNKVVYFSVDGSTVAARRTVVATASCNQCHVSLQAHGVLRNDTEFCVMCHNSINTDAATRPTSVVAADRTLPAQGVNFNLLVHRIHFGINMQAYNRTYVVVGYGGTHNDFSGDLFDPLTPTGTALDTQNCSMCHVNGSEQNLPTGLSAVLDPQGPINPIQPVSSACSGCHLDLPSASHFLANTTVLGESCAVCHASGAAYAVDQVHAQY